MASISREHRPLPLPLPLPQSGSGLALFPSPGHDPCRHNGSTLTGMMGAHPAKQMALETEIVVQLSTAMGVRLACCMASHGIVCAAWL